MNDTHVEPRQVEEPGGAPMQVWDLPTDEDTLLRLITDLFEQNWRDITFGMAPDPLDRAGAGYARE